MLAGLIANIQITASRTAHTAVLGAGGVLALLIGLGFWTLAGWLYLTTVTTALNAAMIVGGIYTGLGLIVFAIMSFRSRHYRRLKLERARLAAAHTPGAEIGSIATAFMGGFSAGSKARL